MSTPGHHNDDNDPPRGGGDPLFEEVHRLICAQTEDRLTPEDARRLESLVLTDPAARRLCAALVRDSAYLRWYAEAPASAADGDDVAAVATGDLRLDEALDEAASAAGRAAPRRPDVALVGESFTDTEDDDEEEPLAVAPNYVRPAAPPPRWPAWARYAAAAAVLVVAAVVAALATRKPPSTDLVVQPPPAATGESPLPAPVVYAKLADAVDAAWDASAQSPRVGQDLGIGPWALASGTARVVFANGADVIVRAPARFQLLSADAMILTEGTASAVAANTAAGFVIHTPTATVRDISTEFGVRVAPATGVTEAHVLRGEIDLKPAAGGQPVRLKQQMAAEVSADGLTMSAIPYAPGRFGRALRTIDLVDVVAGGDGTTGRRGAGVDPRDGTLVTAPPQTNRVASLGGGDGEFHRNPATPLIAGVFIPPAGGKPTTIDPAGHVVTDLSPKTGNGSWYWIWAGGTAALPEDPLKSYPTSIGATDYASDGRGLILMQANKGITFDLDAIRAAHPGRAAFTRFRAVCGNASASIPRDARKDMSTLSDVRVLVDGRPLEARQKFDREKDAPFAIDAPLPADARYLTLLVADGGDGLWGDWILFGDPRLE